MVLVHHRCMMTQPLRIDILSAPVAAIDRRALSQAWYSALRESCGGGPGSLPRPGVHDASGGARFFTSCEKAARMKFPSRPSGAPGNSHTPPRHRARPVSATNQGVVAERRVRDALARKIEAMLLDPRRSAGRSTFVVDASGARVQVMLRTVGVEVRLIAVCSSGVRERVAKALEEARYALAGRGVAFGFEMKERAR
jgi:hypothetical protein